jgi:hypothetical protein
MPFLEVLTRTYKRPKMLAINEASMRAQTDRDFTHTLLNDPEGRGIRWSYTNLASYAPFLVGEYIWILDDDDMCVSQTLIADLKEIVKAHSPAAIMVKMDHGERGILPSVCWQRQPEIGGIGCSAFVVKRQVWQKHARFFTANYAGDFDFIDSIFARDYDIYWFDCVASKVQKISYGAAE